MIQQGSNMREVRHIAREQIQQRIDPQTQQSARQQAQIRYESPEPLSEEQLQAFGYDMLLRPLPRPGTPEKSQGASGTVPPQSS